MNKQMLISEQTLNNFLVKERKHFPQATGQLSTLLQEIAAAGKRIAAAAGRGALADILGDTGERNTHAEKVQRLDSLAHQALYDALREGFCCAGIASEEAAGIEIFDHPAHNRGKYVVLFDPLDGSSNISLNLPTGSIFGIYKRCSLPGTPCTAADFLQPGYRQVAAGYLLYGAATMLVIATRRGVNGFTLHPAVGEFCLSHPAMRIPGGKKTYGVNEGYYRNFEPAVQHFIDHCKEEGCSLRYTGSMVGDMHRLLMEGGYFLYPGTKAHPAGKLRLQYECNPFAFIVAVAGGTALSDKGPVLDIIPAGLHETCAVCYGETGRYMPWQ
jgi:fructose-1,6-bisphosphatase I